MDAQKEKKRKENPNNTQPTILILTVEHLPQREPCIAR
jgi:hypothetical protein